MHPVSSQSILAHCSTRRASFVSMWHQKSGENRLRQEFGPAKARFHFVDHHLAHAISAYAFSGFDDAAVLVLDGRGAWEATSLWHGRDGHLEHVWTIPWPNSLGLFYAQFTQYLGFQPYSDEWKVMGLAPYGEPGLNLREFIIPDDNPYRVAARLLIGKDSTPTAAIESRLGPSAHSRVRYRLSSQEPRVRRAGFLRAGDADSRAGSRGENTLPQSVSCRAAWL